MCINLKPQKGESSTSTALKNGRFCSVCYVVLALASKFEHVWGRWGRVVLYWDIIRVVMGNELFQGVSNLE